MWSRILSTVTFRSIVARFDSCEIQTMVEASSYIAYVAIGSPTSFAHDWSKEGTGGGLFIKGRHFVDGWGRVCNLRGVNVSGNCKTPVNDDHESFPKNKDVVTFVGRPFPLEDAPEHLARLRRWGLTFVRFLVTWEAIEHEGPGIYDTEYLNYLQTLLSLFSQYSIVCYVSLHQDVWSRYSGGSGAPAWTLSAVGFDIEKLEQCQAAWLQGVKGQGHAEDQRGLWPTGYQKLSASTMFTLFWAGDVFAPLLKVKIGDKEVSAQTFLQEAFMGAWEQLARAVGHLDAVIGFEMMNEPHRGYIDIASLHAFDYNTDLHLGLIPSALQSFILGSGRPANVRVWTRSFPIPSRHTSTRKIVPTSSAWSPKGPTSGQCLWEMHGVWGWDRTKSIGVPLRETYFQKHPETGKKVEWYTDFYWPFTKRWMGKIHSIEGLEKKWIFVEGVPNELCESNWMGEGWDERVVFAPHWYDLSALFHKWYGNVSINVQGLSKGLFILKALYYGHASARNNYSLQLRNIVEAGYRSLGEKPVIIGETGVPMDMNGEEAFRTGQFTWQAKMMDALMTGIERSMVGVNLWNYNPDNDDKRGDDWNGENFSWFSSGRARAKGTASLAQNDHSLDQGGRILRAIVRPYPAKVAGVPLSFDFEIHTGRFVFSWALPEASSTTSKDKEKGNANANASVSRPPLADLAGLRSRETEIFLPNSLVRNRKLIVKGIRDELWTYKASTQTLYILNPPEEKGPGHIFKIEVAVDPPLREGWKMNSHWTDFGIWYISFVLSVLSLVWALVVRHWVV
ncbi:glycoside hydrolase family 5 protein [Sistotremastrum niveocremeum HHB9708]|uniref:Glycoside hydrolase family 5 protein n=1 Tax=Sistotremastrum niveocremeum HHB9708 TaxID=1314777 RepID=A0A164MM33_9AGAM|nr:glycoside hydrolase family 5 protein [Sistotremastrum niveocremeum HHB9708]